MSAPRLILASASPRRQQLLTEAGYTFGVCPASIDESIVPPNLAPGDVAEYLARRKAEVVAERFPDDVILAADTVVAHGPTLLGKPTDPADARRMLGLLSGTTHSVITGVAVVHATAGFQRHARVVSSVHMRPLTDAEITRYVASRDWEGKAGGYGIQDPDPFVTRTSGCHTNIVGLPMTTTASLLRAAGITPSAPPP
ncbi:MAG TPA: Maf family protein [Tepidisphaeraceae bacterium]|nr:Maf family protein [Tepidisphaeraceae bacterium]